MAKNTGKVRGILSVWKSGNPGDITRSPKQGYQWPHKKDLYPPKKFFFLKKQSTNVNGVTSKSKLCRIE